MPNELIRYTPKRIVDLKFEEISFLCGEKERKDCVRGRACQEGLNRDFEKGIKKTGDTVGKWRRRRFEKCRKIVITIRYKEG